MAEGGGLLSRAQPQDATSNFPLFHRHFSHRAAHRSSASVVAFVVTRVGMALTKAMPWVIDALVYTWCAFAVTGGIVIPLALDMVGVV